jgi:hypothetical protein
MGSSNPNKDVKQEANTAAQVQAQNAQQAFNQVNPIYAQLAQGNTGLTDQQKTDALTASGQSLGGGLASAVGQGGLMAARTGNAGGATAALDDAARQAAVQQSQNALAVQNQDAALKEQNRQIGLAGLNGIYNTGTGAQTSNLNTSVSAGNSQKPSFWQNLAGGALGGASAALGGV